MPKKATVHIFVSGKVQGVFFRANTKNRAQDLGLKGWVKNLADGRVEAVFEGPEPKIKKMLEWVEHGPPLAKVDQVKTEWQEFKDKFDNFKVKP